MRARLLPAGLAMATSLVLAVDGGVIGFHALFPTVDNLDCDARIGVSGDPRPHQLGVIRCYVKALRDRDVDLFRATESSPSVPAAGVDVPDELVRAARSGPVGVTIRNHDDGTTYWSPDVLLHFADGTAEPLGLWPVDPEETTDDAVVWRIR
jgi:hypothetical protein